MQISLSSLCPRRFQQLTAATPQGASGRAARDGRTAADHGAARDGDRGAVDDGVRLRGGDGGTTWVPGAAYVSWSCAPCGAECSGKF